MFGIAGCSSNSASTIDAPSPPPPDAPLTRAGLTNVGTGAAALDYSNPALWLCRPDIGNLNECARDIDSTKIAADNTTSAAPEAAESATAPFDCFYVYPTVTFGSPNDTDFSSVNDQLDALLGQAARFRRICPVYAPLYRQIGISATGALDPNANKVIGLTDVRAAFAYYLANFNKGRPFVLIGHSQGSAVLEGLIALDIEAAGKQAVLNQMISAVLLGGEVRVLKDPTTQLTCTPSTTPGPSDCPTFTTIKPCTTSTDQHCVVAYSSYRVTAQPPANALFGQATEHTKVVCTDPAVLAGNTSGSYKGSYITTKVNNPIFTPEPNVGGAVALPATVTTPFALESSKFSGACVERSFDRTVNNATVSVTYNYLEITPLPMSGADQRPIPPYANMESEGLGFGEHIFDYAYSMDDLIDLVTKQAAAH